jgi:hypothetical protein
MSDAFAKKFFGAGRDSGVRGEWFFLKGSFRPDRSGGRILLIAQNLTQQNR